MKQKNYLALLHKIWLNQKKLNIIFDDNENYKEFYDNLNSNTLFTFGFSPKQIEYILEQKNKYNIANIQSKLEQRKVSIITIKDKDYPESLKNIANKPYLIYLRWEVSTRPKISVVWSRKISDYWERCIENIVWYISAYFDIVSGWASWCDTKAHKVCLDNKNITVSVIWTWIDIDYPTYNKKLYEDIVLNWWAILSIFPLWEPGNPYNFPIRNEVVAWLWVWVLVVEAMKRSWTLITANLALDLWKDLFAIPWTIFMKNSEWCNMLIKKSMAKLTTKAQDILEEYNIVKNTQKKDEKIDFSCDIEKSIYEKLLLEPLNIDELSISIWLDIKTISFKLSMMELSNKIKIQTWWKYNIF